ncbi:methyltransferase domain-containing protein [Nocardioides sp.]|uniref:class I SAM-dependent methyltransferase n=1 Tax=Nocardioides sp. TaxID=35761 RepID=UPI00286BF6D5|nr:methyltransferase domain-containing protein [Nocardioides sp.]
MSHDHHAHDAHDAHEAPTDMPADITDLYSQATWDTRYAESDRVWSGNPNPRLVEHVADLTPGRALDVGCGEGADVVWLAGQGWQVTGADVSPVALAKAGAHAAEAGVRGSVELVQVDVIAGEALPGGQDLVSVQFFHPPAEMFVEVHQRLGAAVAPGGHLLVVGHHPDDLATGARRPHGPDLLFTPERVVAALDQADWEIVVVAAPTREHQHADGPVTVRDTVVLAKRR